MLISIQGISQSLEKSFVVKKKFINIPIQTDQPRQRVIFKVDGEKITLNDIRISKDQVDYWTFVDVSKYLGAIFLGSAVIAYDNTSGFRKGEENPLVAI